MSDKFDITKKTTSLNDDNDISKNDNTELSENDNSVSKNEDSKLDSDELNPIEELINNSKNNKKKYGKKNAITDKSLKGFYELDEEKWVYLPQYTNIKYITKAGVLRNGGYIQKLSQIDDKYVFSLSTKTIPDSKSFQWNVFLNKIAKLYTNLEPDKLNSIIEAKNNPYTKSNELEIDVKKNLELLTNEIEHIKIQLSKFNNALTIIGKEVLKLKPTNAK